MAKQIVPEELCSYIEALQYEVNARKDLCAFMIDHSMMDSPQFERYHKEYIECNIKYNAAKDQLTKMFNVKGPWNLEFETRELTYEDEAQ